MKNLFTRLFILFILGSIPLQNGFIANATTVTTQFTDETLLSNSTLTLQRIKGSSWEELETLTTNITSEEDMYLTSLVENLKNPMISSVYHDKEFIYYEMIIGLSLAVDLERLFEKSQSVLDVYNASHELQVELLDPSISGNGTSFSFYFQSTNAYEVILSVNQLGQVLLTNSNTTYWETSYHFGTGKHNFINEHDIVIINGVSYLREDGSIESSSYKTYEQLLHSDSAIAIDASKKYMLHICSETTDFGWIFPEYLSTYGVEGLNVSSAVTAKNRSMSTEFPTGSMELY